MTRVRANEGNPPGLSRRALLTAAAPAALAVAAWPRTALARDAAGSAVSPVAMRGDPGYELWRQSMVWNYRKPARWPDAIVQAETIDDVVAAVRLAANSGRKITTRASGHSMSACFMRNEGLLLDVSRLQEMRMGSSTEVIVGPGVIGRALNEFLRPKGLAVSTAHCGMVGVSGFMLGGGVGWNGNAWGPMATFNIAAVDIVTADGQLRHASMLENPDLFWAARGGGPGLFGVVVRLYIKCFPLPRSIQSVAYVYPLSDIVEIARAVAEIGPKVHSSVELLTIVERAPKDLPMPCQGPGCDQAVYVNAIVFGDSAEEAAERLLPLTSHPIIRKAVQAFPMQEETFETLYMSNELSFAQKRWEADNVMTDHPEKIAQILLDSVPNCPTDDNAAVLVYKGNPALPDAAYSVMGAFYLAYYMVWDDAADDIAVKRYHVDFFKKAQKFANGSYINEFNQEGRPEDIPQCFSPKAWSKLAGLRQKWDPKGVFQSFYGQASHA